MKQVLAGSGFRYKDNIINVPNTVHANYMSSIVETYTTLPPLCKVKKTQWGDEWNQIDYPTADTILN